MQAKRLCALLLCAALCLSGCGSMNFTSAEPIAVVSYDGSTIGDRTPVCTANPDLAEELRAAILSQQDLTLHGWDLDLVTACLDELMALPDYFWFRGYHVSATTGLRTTAEIAFRWLYDDGPAKYEALCAKADVIVPNLTEACLLLNRPYIGETYSEETIRGILRALTGLGAKQAIVTGVSFSPDRLGAMAYDSVTDTYVSSFGERVPGSFHGTGDIFASVCVGALTGGRTLREAVALAVGFTCECIGQAAALPERSRAFGVPFEWALPLLIEKAHTSL